MLGHSRHNNATGILSTLLSTLLLTPASLAALFTTSLLIVPTGVQAQQVLEEIVVTAQRREQSLQDVPIAIDVITGDTLQKEGFDNLEEMTAFTPAVFVNEGGDQGSDTFIRGFGTVGRNWANDSAIPLFLDNVNLGQGSMGALGFMDTQRVEVLKGPQPIHFGLNATGGAISIVTARPTDDWQGSVHVEMGQAGDMSIWKRYGNHKLEAAVGGPLTDTINFRVAGQYNMKDGHLRDSVTGYPMGYRNFIGGRLSLTWEPNDNLSVFTKFEMAQQQWAGASRTCRRPEGDYPNRYTRTGPNTFADVETDPGAMWLPFDEGGTGWATPIIGVDDCNTSGDYLGQTYVREAPIVSVRTRDTNTGFPDIRLASAVFLNQIAGDEWTANPTTFGTRVDANGVATTTAPSYAGFKGNGTGITNNGYMDDQSQFPVNYQVEFNYRFDNDIEVLWVNNYMDSYYQDASADRNTPYAENIRNRLEDYNQKSTELRIMDNAGTIEWMVGAFIQDEQLHFTTIDARAEIRFNNRMNDNRQEALWSSYFGNITYNFFDDQMSLDVGVRYSKVKKTPDLQSFVSSWIYDVTPCRGAGGGANPDIWRGDSSDWGGMPVQDVTPADCAHGLEALAQRIAPEDAMYLLTSLPGRNVNMNNLWFVPSSSGRNIPATWRGNYTASVGMTPWDHNQRTGETWTREFFENYTDAGYAAFLEAENGEPAGSVNFNYGSLTSWDHWDPQVVLRWRPSPDLSTYFKYATAFKAGAYDLGFGGSQPSQFDLPPTGLDELMIDPEYSTTFEAGASGNLFDGRARYQATLFRVDFDDLIATTVTDVGTEDQSTQVINIGKQRAQGLELDGQYLVSDQWQVGFNFSYLDSKFTEFPNANCTEHEANTAAESGCVFYDSDGNVVSDIDDSAFQLINRAGQTAAYAPEFSFNVNSDYVMPFRDEYLVDMGANLFWQSTYYTDFRGFSKASLDGKNGDLNLHLGISGMDEKWRVGLALRNLLEPKSRFLPERTSNISELGGGGIAANKVRSVNLTFKYNFFD
jgi:outer membrane receptor protein involved in Fe transport